MKNKNYPFKPESFLKYNSSDRNNLYRPRKKLTNIIFSLEEAPEEVAPLQPPAGLEQEQDVGYLSVSTFTASGALPVKDVLITIYTFNELGEENVIANYVSDANGQVPLITLPVTYNRLDPFESGSYYFSTYNLRAQAINYYTVNIIDLRIFPETTTYFQIDMIPAAAGNTQGPEQTFVIPPSPVDISND